MAIAFFEASDSIVAVICSESTLPLDSPMTSAIFAAEVGLKSGGSRQYSMSPWYWDSR